MDYVNRPINPDHKSFKWNEETDSKICNRCKRDLKLKFYHRHKTGKCGRNSICKECTLEKAIEWMNNNPDRFKANMRRYLAKPSSKRRQKDWKLRNEHNLTIEEFDEMVKRQERKCEICRRETKLNVDHNHKTGQVRGLLCYKCNFALGHLNENINIALSLIEYILKYNENPI